VQFIYEFVLYTNWGRKVTQIDNLQIERDSMDRDIKLVDDIFRLLVEKGPLSIYGIASQLQNRKEYKDLSWNALRMKITRLIYRLVMAGMLEYKRGPRNSKQVDLSYKYLRGECIHGCVPEDILLKWKIDIKRLEENTDDEIKRLLESAKIKLNNFDYVTLTLPPIERTLAEIVELLEPDLFRHWWSLAERVKEFYFKRLLQKTINKKPELSLIYLFLNIDEYNKSISNEEERIDLREILFVRVSDALDDIFKKYCNTDECKKKSKEYFDKYELIVEGVDDSIVGSDDLGLMMSKYIIPNIIDLLNFQNIIADLKYLYLISGKVADPNDIKEIFKKALFLVDTEGYIKALINSIQVLLPYIERRSKLVEIEANVYKGLIMALNELLTESSERIKK